MDIFRTRMNSRMLIEQCVFLIFDMNTAFSRPRCSIDLFFLLFVLIAWCVRRVGFLCAYICVGIVTSGFS